MTDDNQEIESGVVARSPRRKWIVTAGIVVATVAGGIGFAAQSTQSAHSAPVVAPSSAVLPPGAVVGSSSAAIARVEALTAEISNVSRVQAKLLTFGELETALPGDLSQPAGSDTSSSAVWAVAVSGGIHPAFDVSGIAKKWAIITIDAATGVPLGTIAASDASWPTVFDTFPDASQAAAQ